MATIFCFSSTGNSLYVAKEIADRLDGNVAPMNGEPGSCGDNVIGFVFPVYFWGLPRVVERFISGLEIGNKDAYVFAIATYGGAAPGVNSLIKKLLKQKGVALNYGATLKMVDNYIPVYNPKESEALWQSIRDSLAKIADDVSHRESGKIAPDTFMNRIAHTGLPKEDGDQYFHISPACTGCGICQQICPVDNITIEEGRPVFHHQCEHCLGCLQGCPVSAIDWKQKTKGKERFRNSEITLDELISFNQKGREA